MMQTPIRCTPARLLSALFTALMSMSAMAAQATPSQHAAHSACHNCGTVISTHTFQQAAAHGNGVGVAAGAIVGGLLGNQVGGGTGRTLATVAGAVGGGYAGNAIEKHARASTVTRVRVRMSNGAIRTFTEQGNSRWHAGSHVLLARRGLQARA